ncbi:MAG TPA: AraC family transcriptional regulator [Propionibacteriaceae bacterium]|jgi:AraC-like DNA-binding protein
MLASFEHVVPVHPLTWKLTTIETSGFESAWHFHTEFELTYIRAGHGTRLVGDSVGDYEPGDLTLIGPELPHTYVSTPGGRRHAAVVIQFRRDFLGEDFFDAPMFLGVSALLSAASRGLSFTIADETLARLETGRPDEQTVGLLALLVGLAQEPASVLATSVRAAPALNRATARRVEAMVAVMHEQYAAPITLADIAAAAHVAPSSASRLFSQSTGSNISVYLAVVRVNAACRLLRDTDLSVTSIAMRCGFVNLSNFNRRFKSLKQTTPRDYRARFAAATGHPGPSG